MELDRVILIDPAPSGKSGIIVTATVDKMRIFTLEAIKRPMKPNEFVDLLFKLVVRWWPRVVVIEEVIFSALYKPWVEREMQIRNVRFNIQMVKPKRTKRDPGDAPDEGKRGRVRALGTYFSAGQIWFAENQTDLIEEYDNFGATDDYHLLDALAYGPEVWRALLGKAEQERRAKIEENLFNERDISTGYSAID